MLISNQRSLVALNKALLIFIDWISENVVAYSELFRVMNGVVRYET